jgi:hypothetical protein
MHKIWNNYDNSKQSSRRNNSEDIPDIFLV